MSWKSEQHLAGEEIKIPHPSWRNGAAVFEHSKEPGKNLLETKKALPLLLNVMVRENKVPQITVNE